MQANIDAYFDSRKPELLKDPDGNVVTDKQGRSVWIMNPPTLTGLALALGFCSRQSIYDIEKKSDQFSYTIKKARLRCENWVEDGLLSANVPPPSGIFILKNYGWKDKHEHELSGPDGGPIETINYQDVLAGKLKKR